MNKIKDFEIIDFHTHPFMTKDFNICNHIDYCHMSPQNTLNKAKELGITKICGSVIKIADETEKNDWWGLVKKCNAEAAKLKDFYGDFYVPGFHVHPDFVRESCEEIDKYHKAGFKLVGELVPYLMGYKTYSGNGLDEIIEYAGEKDMVVSIHSMWNDDMDKFVKLHKNVKIVAAHPNEYGDFMRHMERMKMSDNYYLDISGYGVFREGMLRHAIDTAGVDRILFGSDYPTCNVAMYVGAVLLDDLITDKEKEAIFSLNAKRLLGL